MRRIAFSVTLALVLLLLHVRQPATAATTQLLVSQACSGSDLMLTVGWTGNDPSALQQWLDVSTANNGWRRGSFMGVGPFGPGDGSVVLADPPINSGVFVRVNQQLPGGVWDPTATYFLATSWCGFGPGNGGSSSSGVDSGGSSGSSGSGVTSNGRFVPFAGNGLGTTLCNNGLTSNSAGRGTCSSQGGVARKE